MNEDRDLQELVDYHGPTPVLSVYLDTDLAAKPKEAVYLLFREAVRGFDCAREIERVQRFLDFEYDWQSRGVAVFAAGEEFWKAIRLPIAVSTQAFWMERPYVRVLTDVRDRFGRYNVALMDKMRLRLFSVEWGRIQAETEAQGEELKRHKQGGWAAARYQRHEDNLALHNLKEAVETIQAFMERTGVRRLILGGSNETLAQVYQMMPKPLQECVIGQFTVDLQASPKEILDLSLGVAYKADLEAERRLVEEAITAAAKGGTGVIGLHDTLYALHQGRVRHLLVAENYHTAGYVCTHCGYAAEERVERCPFCQHEEMEEAPDVVNWAIRKAMETGAEVNIVRQNEALNQAGGVVATLRY